MRLAHMPRFDTQRTARGRRAASNNGRRPRDPAPVTQTYGPVTGKPSPVHQDLYAQTERRSPSCATEHLMLLPTMSLSLLHAAEGQGERPLVGEEYVAAGILRPLCRPAKRAYGERRGTDSLAARGFSPTNGAPGEGRVAQSQRASIYKVFPAPLLPLGACGLAGCRSFSTVATRRGWAA